jgi:hypothetical protein
MSNKTILLVSIPFSIASSVEITFLDIVVIRGFGCRELGCRV